MSNNDIEFNFFGNIYHLKEKNGDITTSEVVSYVQELIGEIQQKYSHMAPHKQMVLAFLRLGKECLENKKKIQMMEEVYLKKTNQLINEINKIIE